MAGIRLISDTTDLSKLDVSKYDWDVVINKREFYVVRIKDYVHTIGGSRGENDLWAYPRDQQMSVRNLVEFNGEPICWGVEAKEVNSIIHKWDESEARMGIFVSITRNGEKFFTFRGCEIGYALARARVYISEFEEHPLNLFEIGYDQKAVGRKVWWRDQPAIVSRFIHGQACVMLKPDGFPIFNRPNCHKDSQMFYDQEDIKADILDKHIWWFRD